MRTLSVIAVVAVALAAAGCAALEDTTSKVGEKGKNGAVAGCYDDDVSPGVSLDDLKDGFDGSAWLETSLAMLKRRYPAGHCLIEPRTDEPYLPQFVDSSSWEMLAMSLDTMVHEMTHLYPGSVSADDGYKYYVNCDTVITTTYDDGFPRSEIYDLVEGSSTDLYKDDYLIELGDQGFNSLLDEWNAYVNGFGASVLFADQFGGPDGDGYSVSAVDGPLAFAYYVELYLRVARTDHPAYYETVTNSDSVKEVLLTTWNRMHFFLAMADGMDWLKVEADAIAELTYAPDNLAELEEALRMTLARSNCQK